MLKTESVYFEKPIYNLGKEKKTGSYEDWDRLRKDIFKFAKFCDRFIYTGYVFATPDGEPHDAARIAPLYFEWNKPRVKVPDRNIIAVVYMKGKTMGYLLANEVGTNVHIDIICAKPGFGKVLMTEFIQEFGHKNIKLNALSPVLSYYQRFGFHFGDKCGEKHPRLENMAKVVKSKGTFDAHTLENAYRSRPEVKKLLDTLKSKKLNVYKTPCDSKELSCFAVDGFRMVRCKTRRAHKN